MYLGLALDLHAHSPPAHTKAPARAALGGWGRGVPGEGLPDSKAWMGGFCQGDRGGFLALLVWLQLLHPLFSEALAADRGPGGSRGGGVASWNLAWVGVAMVTVLALVTVLEL